jgi:hypothetical protein
MALTASNTAAALELSVNEREVCFFVFSISGAVLVW